MKRNIIISLLFICAIQLSADNLEKGELIGIDSGNQFSHELYKTDNRNAYEGRILVTIKPTKAGSVTVKAISDNLITGVKTINIVN